MPPGIFEILKVRGLVREGFFAGRRQAVVHARATAKADTSNKMVVITTTFTSVSDIVGSPNAEATVRVVHIVWYVRDQGQMLRGCPGDAETMRLALLTPVLAPPIGAPRSP